MVQNRFKKLDLFASVLSYIENDYVDQIEGKSLIYGAIQGMMGKLDPFSTFIPPKQYQEMKAETSGEHGGPGLVVNRLGPHTVITHVVPEAPAHRAGIRRGDRLTKVGRRFTKGISIRKIRSWLRGRPGSQLYLRIWRKGWKKERETTIIREQIRVQSVISQTLEPGYYYVRVKSFQDRTERQLKAALYRMKGKKKIRGLLLDLRSNPGGLFDQSVRVADLFIEKGLLVSTRGRKYRKEERELAHKKGTMSGFPIVVLVNSGTASAAEILAGALQDHRRALIIGMRTYGKGSVQSVIDLTDGSGLKLTVARYYTPLGRMIHKRGITPDVKVKDTSRSWRDRQRKKGLYYLKKLARYRKSLGRGLSPKWRKKKPPLK